MARFGANPMEVIERVKDKIDENYGKAIFMGGFSMHDDDGGWIQRLGLSISHPDGTPATRVIVMDGQGAYDGLTVVAEVSLANERYDWHGYIVDGELPPAPTIELPE